MAMYFADQAVVVTNPEVSSVRDSDRVLGLLHSKTFRAENNDSPILEHLLITRYNPTRVQMGEMLSCKDIQDILAIPLLGIIPESTSVLKASNTGAPVVLDDESDAGKAYHEAVKRLLGHHIPVSIPSARKGSFLSNCLAERTQPRLAHELI